MKHRTSWGRIWALFIPSDQRFVPLLRQQVGIAVLACALLVEGGSPARMAEVEADGDIIRRELTQALNQTFATPFDRDDIFALSRQIDDVIDAAQDALLAIAVFGNQESGHVWSMTEALAEGTRSLSAAVDVLPSSSAASLSRKAKKAENVVASLYRYGVDLGSRQLDPAGALRLREVLRELRQVGRCIGRAADTISDIVVKER